MSVPRALVYVLYTQFLPRPAKKESNVPKLKSIPQCSITPRKYKLN